MWDGEPYKHRLRKMRLKWFGHGMRIAYLESDEAESGRYNASR